MDKTCSQCKKTKPIDEFYFRKDTGKYRADCKKCHFERGEIWRQKNREKLNAYCRRKRSENPKYYNDICKKYRTAHPERKYESTIKWVKKNPIKAKEIQRRSWRKRRKTPKGNLSHRMEVSIRAALKENKSGRKWEDLVGYSVKELKERLESQFTEGMNWEKFLNGEIHIDHIIPKSAFNFTKPEHIGFQRAWALENLQPLWAEENMSKNDKLFYDFQSNLAI